MTTTVWALVVLSVVTGAVGWVAAASGTRPEVAFGSRIAAMAVLVLVALVVDTDAGGVKAWFVVGVLALTVAEALFAAPAIRDRVALAVQTTGYMAFAFGASLLYQERIAVAVGLVLAVIVVRDGARQPLVAVRLTAPDEVWLHAAAFGSVAVLLGLAAGAIAPAMAAGAALAAAGLALATLVRHRRGAGRGETVLALGLQHVALVPLITGLVAVERVTEVAAQL